MLGHCSQYYIRGQGVDDHESSSNLISILTDLVIKCTLENSERDALPTTINVAMFGPEKTSRETLLFEKISSREWQHKDAIRV